MSPTSLLHKLDGGHTKGATLMLVTDSEDEVCLQQLWDVGDGFGRFCQHLLYFNISVGHQQPKDVTNIEILSLTSKNCHQDKVTIIYVAHKMLVEKVYKNPKGEYYM